MSLRQNVALIGIASGFEMVPTINQIYYLLLNYQTL